MVYCKSCKKDKDESRFSVDSRVFKTCQDCRARKRKKRTYSKRKKITIETCRELARERGGECLSDVYHNAEGKINWRCGEGHEWSARFGNVYYKGRWCPHCAGKARLTIEHCQEIAAERGGECLSETYKNNKTKLLWRCEKGHEWKAHLNSLKVMGSWCPKCANSGQRRVITIEHCQETAAERGGECLSKTYKNQSQRLLWRCEKGHEWKANYGNVYHKEQWCPHCSGNARLTIEHCQEIAAEKGGECLSKTYKNQSQKLLWRCGEGHEWEASSASLINSNSWCPECSGCAKHSLKKCKRIAKQRGGFCLSRNYKNALSNMKWRCGEGHEWEAMFNYIKNRGSWCPRCACYKSERVCREIFERIFEKEFPKKRPDWLGGLELDGFCEELGIAFEYMGLQHYEFVPHYHKNGEQDFLDQKARDIEKRRICFERKIKLILVPYCYNYNNPEQMELFIRDSTRFIRN